MKTERAFYYWKSNFSLDEYEKQSVLQLKVSKLYIKFFDVTWTDQQESAVPAARIEFDPKSIEWVKSRSLEIIPTVFITNETLVKLSISDTRRLASKILQLTRSILKENNVSAKSELQIDCDWTQTTKERYFKLLNDIKGDSLFGFQALSATIRLYQCKYKNKTGIPPVSRGLLMCYNMGNLRDPATVNSILETSEAEKYIGSLNEYPLPLDIALPLFEWKVIFRNGVYYGLSQEMRSDILNDPDAFIKKDNTYHCRLDTLLNGFNFRTGDLVRDERSEYNQIVETAKSVRGKLNTKNVTVSLYHLDSTTIAKYTQNELENIYNSIH
ncbi:MAG: hypothetical protein H7Y31_05670 [Chitinophagaceae bacterium]|nr:hypothetical protein [Chitinophagaceae bacterium]